MIIVTSLKDHADICESAKVKDLISVIDPGFEPKSPPSIVNHLKLGFDDITEVSRENFIYRNGNTNTPDTESQQIPPNEHHIKKIIDFVSNWDQSQPILIHCWCGVSRSMAVATFILCMIRVNNIDLNIKFIRSIAPHANPNKLMLSMFGKYLGVEKELIESFRKYPYTVTYDCKTTFAPISIFRLNEFRNFK